MSVPPDRIAVRPTGDPNKIMGLKKPVFWGIIAVGAILFAYLWYRSKHGGNVAAGTGPVDTTQGLTAADIGGTPADNSFATQTDETALEEQIQQMQQALFQLENSNGGNGAGLPGSNPGGDPGTTPGTTPGTAPPGQHQENPPPGVTGATTGTTIPGHYSETLPPNLVSGDGSGVHYYYNPPPPPPSSTSVHTVTMS